MLPITVYNAMQTYQVTITGDATGVATSLPSFGFQTSAVLNNHKLAGSYTIPAAQAGNIHSYPCGATTVVEQSVRLAQDTAGVNKYSISFYWTAPTYLSDTVTFYTLLNAVDGDGGDHGDYPNTAPNVVLTENPADSVYEAIPAVNAHYDKFIVFPNPTAGNPTVFYNLYAPELVSLTVCDVAGRTVLQVADNEYQFPGEYTYHPTIKTPGVYFIKLVTNGTSQSLKFIKQ